MHKIVAVVLVVVNVISYINLIKSTEISDSNFYLFLVLGVISMIIILITGGILSFDKFDIFPIKILHSASTISAIIFVAITLYKLARIS